MEAPHGLNSFEDVTTTFELIRSLIFTSEDELNPDSCEQNLEVISKLVTNISEFRNTRCCQEEDKSIVAQLASLYARIFKSAGPMRTKLINIFPSIHDGNPHNNRRRRPNDPVGGW